MDDMKRDKLRKEFEELKSRMHKIESKLNEADGLDLGEDEQSYFSQPIKARKATDLDGGSEKKKKRIGRYALTGLAIGLLFWCSYRWVYEFQDRKIKRNPIVRIVESKPVDVLTDYSEDSLDEDTVQSLFSKYRKQRMDLKNIRLALGSFRQKNAREAVVSFQDMSQSHADGWGEVWFLVYKNGWNIDRKLVDGDESEFQMIDIENDGISELWTRSFRIFQGGKGEEAQLISINHRGNKTLYQERWSDDYGTGKPGSIRCSHDFDFCDIDNDGIYEIIDVERKGKCKYTGEPYKSDFVVYNNTTTKRIYKLRDEEFVLSSISSCQDK